MPSTRVYRYGLLPPHVNAQLVQEQMRAAHRYRNDLVQIERARRAVLRDILAADTSVFEAEVAAQAADARCEAAARAAKAARSEARSRKTPPELLAALTAAKAERSEAIARLKAVRAEARATNAPAISALNDRVAEMRRGARELCGVFWGTYLIVEQADEQARKQPLYQYGRPNDPGFVAWRGEGTVAVQLQGGMSWKDAGTDTRLRVGPGEAPKGADPKSRRSVNRRFVELSLRVGSEDRAPIWAKWRMVMHRPLPEDAVIKWARVQVKRIGPREEWSALFTIETDTNARRPVPQEGVVGLDLGWRSMQSGLRVGAFVASDGVQGFVKVPEQVPSSLEKVASLQAIRDRAFDEARWQLSAWLAARSARSVPAWFAEAAKTLPFWKSPGRLAGLVRRWRNARWDGDAEGYENAEKWRYHDFHLWEWAESQRTKSLRRRRDSFRVFAATLSKKYRTLVLEDLDLREFAEKEDADGEEHLRRQRAVAAPSELRMSLINAFGGKESGRVVFVDPAYTTQTCHACGSVEKWDQAAEVVHTCGSCHVSWDQDVNAAANLLAFERSGDRKKAGVARENGKTADVAPMRGGRWARAKAKRAERLAQA